MLTKRLLISALLAAGTIGAAATPVASAATTHFESSFGTPVRHEYQGSYRPGHWERERGYRRWHHDHGYRDYGYRGYGHGGYAYRTPRWDRDGDGVANRYDARPNNPYRY